MIKNTVLLVILIAAMIAAYVENGNSMRNPSGIGFPAAQTVAAVQNPQSPAQPTAAAPQQVLQPQQPDSSQGQAGTQMMMPGMQMPSAQQQQNTAPGTQAMGNMGGMGCMMNGMSGMGGMNGMGMGNMGGMGMGGMGMGMPNTQPAMGHTMDQGLTMKEVVYIVSMQDALQLLTEMIRIQEKLLDNTNPNKDALRKELAQVKEKTAKLISDYRGMMTNQTRSE